MRTVILVPRRADHGHRDRVWAWCRARWEAAHPDLPIYEGHHDEGLFNRSAAINRAAELADEDGRWDVALVIDADVIVSPGQVRAAIETAAATGHVTWAFRRWRGLNETATRKLVEPDAGFEAELFGPGGALAWDDGYARRREAVQAALDSAPGDADAVLRALATVPVSMLDTAVEKTTPLSWSCCFAIPRSGWDALGGFDERFEGWGFEDMAFQSAAVGLIGHERIEGDCYHLWHPRSAGLGASAYGRTALGEARESVRNALLGRQYMVAVRRDHGLHDRAQPSGPEEMARDIANLKRDSERYHDPAAKLGLGDLVDAWPTLEELVAQARAYRAERAREAASPRISVVIRTGGKPEAWPARREYLRATLASLDQRVTPGTARIVRRVIFSDWPEDMRAELDTIAEAAGFYVVGSGNRGYTASMQRLWQYLGSRRDPFEYVFMVEDDFVFERDVDLGSLAAVLAWHPELNQVALLRDAFYQAERDKGGILGWPDDSFTPRRMNGYGWLEHRNFWTANPSLFRRSLTETPWPSGQSSERVFADHLFADPRARSAFWGDGSPWIRHIGAVRGGTGY